MIVTVAEPVGAVVDTVKVITLLVPVAGIGFTEAVTLENKPVFEALYDKVTGDEWPPVRLTYTVRV